MSRAEALARLRGNADKIYGLKARRASYKPGALADNVDQTYKLPTPEQHERATKAMIAAGGVPRPPRKPKPRVGLEMPT